MAEFQRYKKVTIITRHRSGIKNCLVELCAGFQEDCLFLVRLNLQDLKIETYKYPFKTEHFQVEEVSFTEADSYFIRLRKNSMMIKTKELLHNLYELQKQINNIDEDEED